MGTDPLGTNYYLPVRLPIVQPRCSDWRRWETRNEHRSVLPRREEIKAILAEKLDNLIKIEIELRNCVEVFGHLERWRKSRTSQVFPYSKYPIEKNNVWKYMITFTVRHLSSQSLKFEPSVRGQSLEVRASKARKLKGSGLENASQLSGSHLSYISILDIHKTHREYVKPPKNLKLPIILQQSTILPWLRNILLCIVVVARVLR